MPTHDPDTPAVRPLRVGIADDDRAFRRLVTVAVEQLGHVVACTAADGEEFLKAIEGQEIDLAILDLDMPVLDGLAVAEELAQTRKLPVILVSGHVDAEQVQLGNEPVHVYLQKPVSIAHLHEAINRIAVGG